MVDVLCDTSFLIHLATKRIKNFDNLDVEIGTINFLVPEVVKKELEKLLKNQNKYTEISLTLDFIKKFKIFPLEGNYADEEILKYVSKNNIIIATMDKNLKTQIRIQGKSTLSIHNDKIIFEN